MEFHFLIPSVEQCCKWQFTDEGDYDKCSCLCVHLESFSPQKCVLGPFVFWGCFPVQRLKVSFNNVAMLTSGRRLFLMWGERGTDYLFDVKIYNFNTVYYYNIFSFGCNRFAYALHFQLCVYWSNSKKHICMCVHDNIWYFMTDVVLWQIFIVLQIICVHLQHMFFIKTFILLIFCHFFSPLLLPQFFTSKLH